MFILHLNFKYLAYLLMLIIMSVDCSEKQKVFNYNWEKQETPQLVGPDFLANNPKDWQIKKGRLETTEHAKGAMRTVFLENRTIEAPLKKWSVSVEAGWQKSKAVSWKDSNKIGLIIGVGKESNKANIPEGYFFGVQSFGKIIVEDLSSSKKEELTSLESALPFPDKFLLSLTIQYESNTAHMLFEVKSIDNTETYGTIVWECEPNTTKGNIALVADLIAPKDFRGCWFNNFSVIGESLYVDNYYSMSDYNK